MGPAVPLPKELCFPTTVISGEIAEFGLKKNQKPNVSNRTVRTTGGQTNSSHIGISDDQCRFWAKMKPNETE